MRQWIRKYFAILFAFSIFLGAAHHHNDLKQHSECQICQINSNLSIGDTPLETSKAYLLEVKNETPQTVFTSQIAAQPPKHYHTRAPPKSILL